MFEEYENLVLNQLLMAPIFREYKFFNYHQILIAPHV